MRICLYFCGNMSNGKNIKKNNQSIKYVLDENGITCPSCLKVKCSINNVSRFVEQLESLKYNPTTFKKNRSIYFEYSKDYKSENDYLKIKWACNECIGRKKALISNTINEQRESHKPPVFAFFDLKSQCAKCYAEFIFKKDEWKYWIDELRFFYQTSKKYCENCSPKEQLKKRLSKKIAEQRELEVDDKFVDLAIEISEIYKELEMKERAKDYLKSILNQFKKENEIKLKEKIKTAYNNL